MAVRITDGSMQWDATIDDTELNRIADRIEARISKLSNKVKSEGSGFEDLAKKAANAAAAFLSVQAAEEFITKMVQVRGEFQQIEIAFTTMLKSKTAADQLMAEAVDLAAKTPFTLEQVASGAKQLLAYGFAASDITKQLTTLGNIAAGVGSQLTDIVYLYGTLKASGRVTQMDINQFAGRGIPIYQALADVLKINVNQVRDFVSAGKVGFKDVQQAFTNLTSPAGQFFNLMQAQSKSLTGMLSNLEDAVDSMFNSFGKANEDFLASGIQSIIDLVQNYEKVIDVIKLIIITYGAYRAAVILNTLAVTFATTATNTWTLAEIVQLGVWKLKEAALIKINALVKSGAVGVTVYTAAIAALGAIIYSFVQFQEAAEITENSLAEARAKGARSAEDEAEKVNDLIKAIGDHTKTKKEQKAAYDELILTTGESFKGYTQEEIAAGKAKGAIENYTDRVRKAVEANKEFADYQGIQEQLKNIRDKGIDAISAFDQAKISLVNFGKAVVAALTGDFSKLAAMMDKQTAFKLVVDVDKARLKKAGDDILKANKDVADLVKKANEERNKDPKAQDEIAAKTAAEIAAAKKYAELLERRKDLEREITDDLGTARAKTHSDEQQAIEAINQKYDKRIAQVDKLNSKLKDGDKISKKPIESARVLDLGTAGVDAIVNGKGGYKDQLEIQKKLFTEYETAKAGLGEAIAEKMYRKQLGDYQTFADYIIDDVKKRAGDTTYLAFEKNKVSAPLVIDAEAAKREQQNKDLADALKNSETLSSARIHIELEFQKQKAAIENNTFITNKGELIQHLEETKNIQIDAAIDENNSKMAYAKRLNEEVLVLTRSQVKEQIKALTTAFGGNVPPEIKGYVKQLTDMMALDGGGADQASYNNLVQRRNDLIKAIAGEADKTTPKVAALKNELLDVAKAMKGLDSNGDGVVNKGLDKFLSSLGNGDRVMGAAVALGDVSDALGVLSTGLQDTNADAAYTIDTLSQLAGTAADLATSIISGDPQKIIQSTIKAVGTLFSLAKKTREANAAARKEVEDFYNAAIQGEKEYQELLLQRQIDTAKLNKSAIAGTLDEYKLRKQQLESYAKQSADIIQKLQGLQSINTEEYVHGTWFRKAKVVKTYNSLNGITDIDQLNDLLKQGKLEGEAKDLVTQLVELQSKGFDAQKTLDDLAGSISELFTGTTSDGLTDAFEEFIESGKTGVEDIANFFTKTMRESAQSIFKNNVLSSMVKKFYDQFSADAQSGEGIDDTEFAKLKDEFTNLTLDAQKQYEQFIKITGSGISDADSKLTGLEGTAISKAMDQDTGNKIEGLMRGTYDYTKMLVLSFADSLKIAQTHVEIAVKNERNTFRTANNTDVLPDIAEAIKKVVDNTKPVGTPVYGDAMRNAGLNLGGL